MQLSKKEKERLRSRYGSWAIVTGASSGIGMELATQLAEAGFNLLLHGRQENKLIAVYQALQSRAKGSIKFVVADIAEQEGIDKLLKEAKDLDVGLFIASAGFGTSGAFVKNSLHAERNMVRVNIEALMTLCHHFAQLFVRQQRGGIVLMSSMVAFQGTPYAANYAATKAYVQTLAEALAEELKIHSVDVLAAAPGPVQSGFGQRANMNMSMAMTPEQIGVPILKALGRKKTVLPGFLTKLLVYSLRTVPRWAKVKIMGKVMGGMTAHQRS